MCVYDVLLRLCHGGLCLFRSAKSCPKCLTFWIPTILGSSPLPAYLRIFEGLDAPCLRSGGTICVGMVGSLIPLIENSTLTLLTLQDEMLELCCEVAEAGEVQEGLTFEEFAALLVRIREQETMSIQLRLYFLVCTGVA